jgi:hypothetical protein
MSSAHESDAILAAARASLKDQRAGGRRVSGAPIGQRSAALRRAEQKRAGQKLLFIIVAIAVALPLGAALMSHTAHLLVILIQGALLAYVAYRLGRVLRQRPLATPSLDTLRATKPKALIGQTQLWLEAQRPALPAPALNVLGTIGAQLDSLALQLDRADDAAPALGQIRQLVGEHLPSLITTYTAIPANLRNQAHAGATPDEQLTQSLTKISSEIDSVTRQMAEGKLDALAIQTRFLDYKYGETGEA